MARHMNRLSTGLRINSAREDAAGMAIANKLSFQLSGLERASDNSQHGISVVQTAEGALDAVHAMLQRIRELAVQAANDTNVDEDRMAIQREINDLTDEITAISARSEFNSIKLLNGEAARVATNWMSIGSGAFSLTRLHANTLFVSDNMPPGTLRYNVENPARPARVESYFTDVNWANGVAHMNGRITINSIPIDIRQGESLNSIWERMVIASEYAGVIPIRSEDGVPLAFESIRHGSHETVELSGSAELWRLFGIYMPATSYAHTVTAAGSVAPGAGYAISDLVTAPAGAVGHSGIITVNGWPIPITADMAPRDIFDALRSAGNLHYGTNNYGLADWDVKINPDGTWRIEVGRWRPGPDGQLAWVTAAPPNNQVTLTADSPRMYDTTVDPPLFTGFFDFWGAIGVGVSAPAYPSVNGATPAPSSNRLPASDIGADIQLSGVRMYDINNFPMDDFNRSMSFTTSGNRVHITSAQGKRIELNIFPPQTFSAAGVVTAAAPAAAIPPGVITVNGVSIAVTESMDIDDIIQLINDNTNIPVTASGPPLILTGANIVLGGSREVLEAIGFGDMITINKELRIEAFGGLRVQIGPSYNMFMDIHIPRINAETLGLVDYREGRMIRLLHLTTVEGATRAIDQTDAAITRISRVRAQLGAYQNRLEHTIDNLDNAAVNTATARSRIQDTDMAREMTLLAKRQVMYQAGLAILGQANQRPQMILQLLQ